jgi:hypothetical protein
MDMNLLGHVGDRILAQEAVKLTVVPRAKNHAAGLKRISNNYFSF